MIDLLVLEARRLRAQLVEIRGDLKAGRFPAADRGLDRAIRKIDDALATAGRARV